MAEHVTCAVLASKNLFLSGKGAPYWPPLWTPPLGLSPEQADRLAQHWEPGRARWASPLQSTQKEQKVQASPQPQSSFVRSRFSARQINYKLAGRSEYSDWPFAGEKLKAWEERGHFMGPSHRKHSSVTRIFIVPDCRSKSWLSF